MRQKIQTYISKFPLVYTILRKIYRTFIPPPPGVREVIKRVIGNKPFVFFVQVGSGDGVQGDPIHDIISNNQTWTGIFIEPVKFLFQRLKNNYHDADRFIFENVAVGTKRGEMPFYYVSENAKAELGDHLPFWHDQLGSFNKEHILEHLEGKLGPFIVEEEIECVPLQAIFERYKVEKIDLLHIDTEGFDYKVLSQVDFKRYKPLVVLYEHFHLPVDEKNQARALLESSGYDLFEYGGDTLALFKGEPGRVLN